MRTFSIKELERFSGIKTHTIRMWERRYAFFKPQRTKGNVRLYSLDEVALFLKFVLLLNKGFRISKLSEMDAAAVEQEINSLNDDGSRQLHAVNQLIIFMFSTDIEAFEQVLYDCVVCQGIDTTIKKVIIPFLQKVNIFSFRNSQSEWHFVVTAIRKKIIVGIENSNPHKTVSKTALLYLPKGEFFDLPLLYMAYIIRSNGLKVLYMGTDVANEHLEMIIHTKKPDFLFTYIPPKGTFKTDDLLHCLDMHTPQAILFIAVCDKKIVEEKEKDNLKFINFSDIPKAVENAVLLQSLNVF